MTRFAIDVREACRARKAGKGQWVHGFVAELLRRELPVVLYTDQPLPDSWRGAGAIVHAFPDSGFRWHMRVARHVRGAGEVDAFVSPTSFLVPCLLGARFPSYPVVHDLIAFRGEPHDRRATMIERLTLGRAARQAAGIFTVSESTRSDLLTRYPSLPPPRVAPIFAGPLRIQVSPAEPDGRTILCIATLCPRKNQARLIQAFARLSPALRSRHRLLLVGARGWQDQDIVELASQTPGVEWRDYVDDAEYERLLSHCFVFALPSLYEGFGMQLLDALQRGLPVLTSDRGSLREVCGNAAYYVDPEDIGSIASGLEALLNAERLRMDLRERALQQSKIFSWEKTVDLFLGALTS